MFDTDLRNSAERLLSLLRADAAVLATAESCTGGLVAALLTDIPGSSDVIDRGFVTYSNEAKSDCLGVDPELIARLGAVSEEVARAMAEGALVHSSANIAISITGIAGPGGGTPDKPVGRVHLAVAHAGGKLVHHQLDLGDIGRTAVRLETVRTALKMLSDSLPVTRTLVD